MCKRPDLLTSEGRALAGHIFAKAYLVEGIGARRQDRLGTGVEGAGYARQMVFYPSDTESREHAAPFCGRVWPPKIATGFPGILFGKLSLGHVKLRRFPPLPVYHM